MKKFIQLLTIVMASSAMLTACVAAPSSPEVQTVVVTPAATGNSASLKVGDILEIQIPTIPTEGYEWQAEDLDTTILAQAGIAEYTADADPNSAGGIVTIRFTAVGAGNTNLTLIYASAAASEGLSLSKNTFGMAVEVTQP